MDLWIRSQMELVKINEIRIHIDEDETVHLF